MYESDMTQCHDYSCMAWLREFSHLSRDHCDIKTQTRRFIVYTGKNLKNGHPLTSKSTGCWCYSHRKGKQFTKPETSVFYSACSPLQTWEGDCDQDVPWCIRGKWEIVSKFLELNGMLSAWREVHCAYLDLVDVDVLVCLLEVLHPDLHSIHLKQTQPFFSEIHF